MIAILILIILIPFFLYELGGDNYFFTYLKTGGMKFKQIGKTYKGLLLDVKGRYYDEEADEIKYGTKPKPFLTRRFGLWWLGIIPFASIRKFKTFKDIENKEGTTPETWVKKSEEKEEEYLSHTFTIPYVLMNVALQDGTKVHMLVVIIYEVVKPQKAIITLNGNYYLPTHSALLGEVETICKNVPDQTAFRALDKSEGTSFLNHLTNPEPPEGENPRPEDRSEYNKMLIKKTGLQAIGIVIPQSEPGDKTLEKLTAEKASNKLQGEADVVKEEYKAQVYNIETAALIKRALELGEAENKGILHGIEDADANMKASVISGVRKAKVIADPGSPLHMWIEGNPSGIIVNDSKN